MTDEDNLLNDPPKPDDPPPILPQEPPTLPDPDYNLLDDVNEGADPDKPVHLDNNILGRLGHD